jgi:3'(2'), 5'-bisphosphate nucleotidase
VLNATELLEALVLAALEAGRVECEIYAGAIAVQHKEDNSPVTAADHAAEAIILARLAQAAPHIPIVAEEEVAAGRVPKVDAEFFLVDPLDGTKEFIAKRGDFTVNIALIRQRQPVLGVVYAPAKQQLYIGDAVAKQAFYADQPPDINIKAARKKIQVRGKPTAGLTAVASRSHSTPETESYLQRFAVAERVSVGSSLKFCLVAAGNADIYPRLGTTMEWDTAAGHAVLLAAGGQVTTLDGAALQYAKPDFRNPHFIASGNV